MVPLHHLASDNAAIEGALQGERPRLPSAIGGLDTPSTIKLYRWLACMWRQVPADRLSSCKVEWFIKDHQADRVHPSPSEAPGAGVQHVPFGIAQLFAAGHTGSGRDLRETFEAVPEADQPEAIQVTIGYFTSQDFMVKRRHYDANELNLHALLRLLKSTYPTMVIMRGFILWVSSTTIQFTPPICHLVADMFETASMWEDEISSEFFRFVPESVENNILRSRGHINW